MASQQSCGDGGIPRRAFSFRIKALFKRYSLHNTPFRHGKAVPPFSPKTGTLLSAKPTFPLTGDFPQGRLILTKTFSEAINEFRLPFEGSCRRRRLKGVQSASFALLHSPLSKLNSQNTVPQAFVLQPRPSLLRQAHGSKR